MQTYQTPGQEVHSKGIGIREYLRKGFSLAEGKGTDVVARSASCDGIELIKRRCTQYVQDESELVVIIAAGEEWLPGEHFRQDAADRPYVDRLVEDMLSQMGTRVHERQMNTPLCIV